MICTHVLNRAALAYAAHSTAKTQRSRANGILLTKRRRQARKQTTTANRAKSLELEAPPRPKGPPPAAALMSFS